MWLPSELAKLVFELCGELQLVRVCRDWRAWFQQAWQKLARGLRRVCTPLSKFSFVDLVGCVVLQLINDNDEPLNPRMTTRLLDVCGRLPNLRRLKFVGFHMESTIGDPDTHRGIYTQPLLKTIEFERCRFSDGLWPMQVPLVLVRNIVGSPGITAQAPLGVTLAMDVRPRSKKYDNFYRRQIAQWILPETAPGTEVAEGVRLLSASDEATALLRQQIFQGGHWHFLVGKLKAGSLTAMPDGTRAFFGTSHTCDSSWWAREEQWTQADFPVHGRSDSTRSADGLGLVLCNSLVSAAEVVTCGLVWTGWLPTPEPLSKLQYFAGCFFGLGARDPRRLWKLGSEGQVVASFLCEALPSTSGPCMLLLLATQAYVHVRTSTGFWQNVALDLAKCLGSGEPEVRARPEPAKAKRARVCS
jgi:hypothetical protein